MSRARSFVFPVSIFNCLVAASLTLSIIGAGCGTSDAAAGDGDTPDMTAGAPLPDLACAKTSCQGRCVDVSSDQNNCGACGKSCFLPEVCIGGMCATKPCTADGDCDDRIGCTVDVCSGGLCTHAPGPNQGMTACPMGNTCDVMKGCIPGAPPLVGPNLCAQAPPMGAVLAPAPPKYAGMCPKILPAPMETTITTAGNQRLFMVAIPKDLDPKEKLPVLFLWHWLGGNDSSFYKTGDVQNAVDQQRFIAVIAQNKKVNDKSDLQFKWPFTVADTQARIDEELHYFDDMFACVAEQFNINKECVNSAGVSAGALWTDQLVQLRNNVFSSGISLSGGTGGLFIRPWKPQPRHIPMLVLWGGPMDTCIVLNFQDASHDLEKGLAADGAFTVECTHNCKHGVPPIDPPMGISTFSPIWQFAFDHPYWLKQGTSPYQTTGLPTEYPTWCAVGAGNAIIRTGMCPPPGC